MGIDAVPGWAIDAAGSADAEALALVACATFLEAYASLVPVDDMLAYCAAENSAEAFRRFVAEGAQLWLARAEETGVPLGYAMLVSSTFADSRPGDIELKRIYVLERCHGTRLASELLARAEAAAQGYRRLLLGVNRHNLRAQGFYRKQGFELSGTRQFVVAGAHYDDFIFAKPLDPAGMP